MLEIIFICRLHDYKWTIATSSVAVSDVKQRQPLNSILMLKTYTPVAVMTLLGKLNVFQKVFVALLG